MSDGRDLIVARWRDPVALISLVVASIGAFGIFVVTRRGLVVSPDSTQYLAGAESLAGRGDLVTSTGDPLVLFPPFTSVVYAIGEVLPMDTLSWVRVLNAVLIGTAIWLTSSIVARHADRAGTVVVASVFAAVSVGLLFVGRAAWSEPVYLVVVLGFVDLLSRAISDPKRSRRTLLRVAVIVWVAFLTRYAGLVLVPVGAVALLALRRPARVRRASEFVGMAMAVPVLWMMANRWRGGSWFGERPPSLDTFGATLRRVAEVIGGWLVPIEVAPGLPNLRLAAGVLICMALIPAVVLGVVGGGPALPEAVGDEPDRQRSSGVVAAVAALTALASIATVALTQLRTAIDPVDARLLSPALLPSVIAVALLADRAWRLRPGADQGVPRPIGIAMVAALIMLVGTQAVAAARFADEAAPEQWTFTHPVWTGSEVAAAVRALPEDSIIWTNNPYAAWLLTERRSIEETPRSGAYRSDVVVEFPAVEDLGLECRLTYLAWFDRTGPFHHSVERISEAVELADREVVSDGEILRVVPPSSCR